MIFSQEDIERHLKEAEKWDYWSEAAIGNYAAAAAKMLYNQQYTKKVHK